MTTKFVLFCASALFIQAVVGHFTTLRPNLVYGLGGASAASSAASAAAANNAAAASAATASAAAARRGVAGSASSSAAAASAARAAAASSAASSAGSVRGALAGLSDYNIVYSGPLIVSSSSPLYPNGLFLSSENTLEGPVYVNGALPFLSAVGFEGSFPTSGSGVATCGCGSGTVGIVHEV